MYPDLSYLLHDIFPSLFERDGAASIVKMFGLLLAIAFLASAYVCGIELRRKEEEGLISAQTVKIVVGKAATPYDLIINGLIGFFIGFKFLFVAQNFAIFKADAAGVIFSTQGSIIGGIIGAILFGFYQWWESNKNALPTPQEKVMLVHPYERVGDITIVAAFFGILGAKLFSILENFEDFLLNPMEQLFSGSGLTMYGGLILAFFACYIYVKKLGIKPIHMMDCAAPAITTGYGVGRLGCHFSGDGDWGIVNTAAKPFSLLPDWLWAYKYPNNVLNEGNPIDNCVGHYCSQLAEGVFPTPLYETILCAIMFAILWSLRKRVKVAGVIFFIYLILNGLERFSIESIRVNPRYNYIGFNFSQAQYIALGLIVIGIIGTAYLYFWESKKKVI